MKAVVSLLSSQLAVIEAVGRAVGTRRGDAAGFACVSTGVGGESCRVLTGPSWARVWCQQAAPAPPAHPSLCLSSPAAPSVPGAFSSTHQPSGVESQGEKTADCWRELSRMRSAVLTGWSFARPERLGATVAHHEGKPGHYPSKR